MSEKAAKASTTPAPARQEAVADEQTVAPPTSDVAQDAPPQNEAPSESGKGFCDNHPDVPAEVVTDFDWAVPQRFCSRCVPAHYRALL